MAVEIPWETVCAVTRMLRDRGVEFLIDGEHVVGPAVALRFIDDAEGFRATKTGITREQYIEFRASRGCIQCSAMRTDGKRCKASLGHTFDITEWMRRQGEFCKVHKKMADKTQRNAAKAEPAPEPEDLFARIGGGDAA